MNNDGILAAITFFFCLWCYSAYLMFRLGMVIGRRDAKDDVKDLQRKLWIANSKIAQTEADAEISKLEGEK